MSISEDRLHDILSHVAAKCCMKNWHYSIDEKSATIETYFCILIPMKVTEIIEGKENIQHVYVKIPRVDERIIAISEYMWDAEVYFYKTFIPLWKRVSNVKIDELIPECYHADSMPNYRNIVLKNMKYEKFQNYKGVFLDYEHVVVSLRSLAQFHALSFIIKKDKEQPVVSVLKPYTDVFPPELNEAILNSFRTHAQLFRGSKYENYWEDTLVNYKTIVADTTSKTKCLLYGHGDYWKANILYKYENNIPVKACILDFQACRLIPPAYDFLYFIMNSTNGSLRRLHYHNFVTEFYDCFKNTLYDHGIQLEMYYKEEDFMSDLKIVSPLCFIRICLAFSLWLGFENNVLINSLISVENDQERDKDLYYFKEILTDAMEDLCNYGYISL